MRRVSFAIIPHTAEVTTLGRKGPGASRQPRGGRDGQARRAAPGRPTLATGRRSVDPLPRMTGEPRHQPAGGHQDVPPPGRRGAGRGRGGPRCGRRRVRGRHRAVGLRQVDAAAAGRRPDRAGRGHGWRSAARSPAPPGGPSVRSRAPDAGPAALAHGARQHHAAERGQPPRCTAAGLGRGRQHGAADDRGRSTALDRRRSGCGASSGPGRPSCRGACSNGWPWPGPSRRVRRCC